MGMRDWFRRKPKLYGSEPDTGDTWSPVRTGKGRQQKGPIAAPLRNTDYPVEPAHDNRAGHRQYVRALQARQIRKNIVGFGRWRRHQYLVDRDELMSVIKQATGPKLKPRKQRRPHQIAAAKMARRGLG